MEKVYIKPIAQEIIIKGPAQEGQGDTFSYEYSYFGIGSILSNVHYVIKFEDSIHIF